MSATCGMPCRLRSAAVAEFANRDMLQFKQWAAVRQGLQQEYSSYDAMRVLAKQKRV